MPNSGSKKSLIFTGLLTASALAFAQTAVVNLPAQSLSSALVSLSRQGNVNILAADALVANRKAPAVSGTLTIHDALDRLLQGTGLKAEQKQDGTWIIVAPVLPKPGAPTGATAVLPTITVTDSASSGETGFVSDSTNTATRTDTPIGETPQSIQVINQDLIKSTSVQSVSDALAYAGGVTVQNTGNGTPQISIRGFQAMTMSNGVNDTGFVNSTLIPMAGVERVEVLKGADSILSGAMSPGGIVNVVAKRPTATSVHELTVQAGSYGDWLGAVDLGGALKQDGRLTYRFVLSAERAGESFGGYDGGKTLYVAPSMGWKSGGTEIVLGYQHQVQDEPPVPLTLLDPSGPISSNGSRPTPPGNTLTQSDTLYVNVKQRFGQYFLFESKTQYQASSTKTDHLYLPIGGTPVAASFLGFSGIQRSYGFDTDNHIQAKFTIGPVKQTLLAGFEYQECWTDNSSPPDWRGTAPFPAVVLPAVSGDYAYSDGHKRYFDNVYLQDQLSWGRLHVLASIAHGTAWDSSTASQSAWTPNLGVLYQLTDSVAVYANALRSFNPQSGSLLLGGGMASPSTGRSIEVGFKFNFLDDRLNVTANVFRSAISNQVIPVPGTQFNILGGGQVTRGAEFNATGRLLPGLNLTASYTYSNELLVQQNGSEVPRHSGSLWMTYDLQGERWQGWGGGIGVQARSGYQVTASSTGVTYKVPGQMRTDLSIYYHAKRWSTTLAVKNLFNRLLYQNRTFGPQVVGLEAGRLIYLTSRYNF